jgi:hypothetical protein
MALTGFVCRLIARWLGHAAHGQTVQKAGFSARTGFTFGPFELHWPFLSIRTTSNPFHHLWNNNGTWWCHYTEHLPDFTKRRIRKSLHTSDSGIARVLRDSILSQAAHNEE